MMMWWYGGETEIQLPPPGEVSRLHLISLKFAAGWRQEGHRSRGVIWGGLGGRRPPPQGKRKKEKKKEKKKKEKKEKKRRKKERRELWINVKLLHIKCCFFSNFSIVRWHWKKKIWPPEKVEMTPLHRSPKTSSVPTARRWQRGPSGVATGTTLSNSRQ